MQPEAKLINVTNNIHSSVDNISIFSEDDKANLIHKLCFQRQDKKIVSSVTKFNHHERKQLPPVVANFAEFENEIYLREKHVPVNGNSVLDKETNSINNSIESNTKTNVSNNGKEKKCISDENDCK